jgi:hypothetical protein
MLDAWFLGISGDSLLQTASCLAVNDRTNEARARAQQALEFRQRVLPVGHPDIAAARLLVDALH